MKHYLVVLAVSHPAKKDLCMCTPKRHICTVEKIKAGYSIYRPDDTDFEIRLQNLCPKSIAN